MATPDLPAVLPGLVAQLAAIPQVSRVILFGSRARGDNFPRSDIDLAVDATPADPRIWAAATDIVDEAQTLLPIDLVWMPTAASEILASIEREGIVLYARKPGHGQAPAPR